MYFYCSQNCELFGFPILLDKGYSINASCVLNLRSTGVISGAGTAYLPEHLNSPPVFSGVRVNRCLALYVCFIDRCLSFFFWPLCCLFFFDLRILMATLVSSNSSFHFQLIQHILLNFSI